jgi:PqqD family protein of HPr-rel-A system
VTCRFERVSSVSLESLGNVWAAFSPVSGETVLLNDESAAILEILGAHNATDAAGLAEELAKDCGLAVGEVTAHLSGACAKLEETGFLRRVDDPTRSN